ncbi:MAG TPA: hypothetical protein VFF27_04100 [Bacteroidia bacterium]|jgi:hypothetical protein|nr:hypothetical protein [Bacteroidia bacterium]
METIKIKRNRFLILFFSILFPWLILEMTKVYLPIRILLSILVSLLVWGFMLKDIIVGKDGVEVMTPMRVWCKRQFYAYDQINYVKFFNSGRSDAIKFVFMDGKKQMLEINYELWEQASTLLKSKGVQIKEK